jgi:pimeloyl-ACP methyl ester carboxylesterase
MTNSSIDWTFGGLWPHQPQWFLTRSGYQLHYIDEGPREAPAVVLLHGNPTWGFLYRNFIPPLIGAGYRVVAPDHLGFGRSDKPTDRGAYEIAAHADRLTQLLDNLDLRDVTVVPQDWGGPIGLPWAAANPGRVAGLFILNTAAHVPVEEWKVPLILKLFRMPGVGDVMVKGLNLFHHGFLFRAGIIDRSRLTPAVRGAYLAPHRRWSERTGVLEFPRAIPTSPTQEPWHSFAAALENRMETHLRDKPTHIVWAMKDPGFRPDTIDDMWLRTFPSADVTRLEEAGHYLQEDAHELIVPLLLAFLADLHRPHR